VLVDASSPGRRSKQVSPVGDTARAFQALATEAGIELVAGSAPAGMTNRGHAEPALADALRPPHYDALQRMFIALDGDRAALGAKAPRALQPDFLLAATGQLVELDESQHFTSARLTTLRLYRDTADLDIDYDLVKYSALCERYSPTSDKDFAHKLAAEFPGRQGRQRQRAYLDAVRDLGAPTLGAGPVIRIPAPERLPGPAVDRLRAVVKR